MATIEDVKKTLQSIIDDDEKSADEKRKARALLDALEEDEEENQPAKTDEAKARAYVASRMGRSVAFSGIRRSNDGRTVELGNMSREQARAFLEESERAEREALERQARSAGRRSAGGR